VPVRMLSQTFRLCLGLGLLWLIGAAPVCAKEAAEIATAITVSVYDDAGIGLVVMQEAEEISSAVFARTGVAVHWLNCGVNGALTHVSAECGRARFPVNLQLRFLKSPRDLRPGTFGISYLNANGEGCYSQVFVEPVEHLRGQFPIGMGTLLGHVATHELAHLLLGSNSHSALGIMQAHWGPKELESANMGGLRFYSEQRDKIAARIAAALQRSERLEMVSVSHCHIAAD
jgi:hypothetical protein